MATTKEIEAESGRMTVTRFAGPNGSFRIQIDADIAVLTFDDVKVLRDLLNEHMHSRGMRRG
jgi:hypothetical protein